MINGKVVELQLLSDGEITALFGPRRGIGEGSINTSLKGNEEESASYKERLKLPVDRYGFYIEPPDNDQFHRSLEMSPAVLRQRDAKEGERLQKWLDMRKAWASNGVQRKLNERCRKGIPHKVREWAWYNISHGDRFAGLFRPTAACASNELPAALVSNTTTLDDIERDIPRTFPRHLLFMPKNGIGQLALHRLLRCYAQHDPEVGYCQGMGFIAGMLLTVMDECRALATFIAALSGKFAHFHFPFTQPVQPADIHDKHHSLTQSLTHSDRPLFTTQQRPVLQASRAVPSIHGGGPTNAPCLQRPRSAAPGAALGTPRGTRHAPNYVRHRVVYDNVLSWFQL